MTTTLGKVCDIYTGNSINANYKKTHFEGLAEGFPFIATKDVSFNGQVDYDNGVKIPYDTKYKKAYCGSVLLCAEGGSAGRKIARINQTVCFGNKLFCIAPKDNSLIQDFLYYYLLSDSFQEQFRESIAGVIGGVSNSKIKAFNITFPDLDGQRKIVERLNAAFERIDMIQANAAKAIELAEQHIRLTLKKLLEECPSTQEKDLGKICHIGRGRSKHRPRNEPSLYNGPYPFIQTGDIRDAQGGTIQQYKQTYSEKGLSQSKLWPKGTICMTIAANIGETAILGFDSCFPDSVVGIIPKSSDISTEYLNFYLAYIHEQIVEISRGFAQKNINLKLIDKIKIKYPELSEQNHIVGKLCELTQRITQLKNNFIMLNNEVNSLKQAILKETFE